MFDLILNLVCALVVMGATVISGAPVVFRLSSKGRLFTKIAASFAAGCVLISLAGVLSSLLHLPTFPIESMVILGGIALAFRYRSFFHGELDRDDRIVMAMAGIYILLLLVFFDHIKMWMAGDAVTHASIIRMLLQGESVPISLPPFGTYWEYYPKGFHTYAYYWARLFPVLTVIQTVPVVISAFTPVLLYSLIRELQRQEIALYAFIIACFMFPAHTSYLISGGYPTTSAEMIMVAAILCAVLDWRLIPLMILGMAFMHTRLLIFLAAVSIAWAGAVYSREKYTRPLIALFIVLVLAMVLVFKPHPPGLLTSIFTDQNLAGKYVASWYPALLSMIGAVVAFYRRDKLDRLSISWSLVLLAMLILADIGITPAHLTPPYRVLTALYLPLSILAAYVISIVEQSMGRGRVALAVLLLIIGTMSTGVVFYSYIDSWGMPAADYEAVNWLEEQNYSNATCINFDETGAWIYPLLGMRLSDPRTIPVKTGLNHANQEMIPDPNSRQVIEKMQDAKGGPILIYVSSVSASNPGYKFPFESVSQRYPTLNLSFSREYYQPIYERGAIIFLFRAANKLI